MTIHYFTTKNFFELKILYIYVLKLKNNYRIWCNIDFCQI